MNLQIFAFTFVCLLVAGIGAEEPEYEDEAPIQQSSLFKLPSSRQSLLRSARGPALSSKTQANVPQQSTKPPTPEPKKDYEEAEGEVKDYVDESVPSSTEGSTTEAPKKIGSGFVRPFRSNQDLLETLKKRRQEKTANALAQANVQATSTSNPDASSGPAPSKAKSGSSRKFGGQKAQSHSQYESDQTESGSEKKTTLNRRFSGKGRGSTTTTQTYEEVEEETQPPSRSKTFGRSRRV